MKPEPIIEFKHVAVHFGSLVVHSDLSFRIYPGEIVTILGPSGSGKTVILKLIIGLLRPASGEVLVMGRRINDLSDELLRPIRMKIGMLFQGGALFDSLSVYDNVAYSLHEAGGKTEAEISATVEEKLTIVGLLEVKNKFPPQLSGGQKKRVALARALASSPEVVLFDEPTTGLDPTNTQRIDQLLLRLKQEYRITSVAVTHDIASARRISDRWILIDDGVVAADGAVAEELEQNRLVQDFVSGNWQED